MRSSNRIQAIEALRGIASILICLFHLGSDHLFSSPWLLAFFQQNPFNALVFRIISGFVIIQSLSKIHYQYKDFFSFIKRRYIRLEPSYICSIALVIFLAFISSYSSLYHGKDFTLDIPLIVSNLFHINPLFNLPFLNAPYWSLFVEWQFYLLIGLTAPLFFKYSLTSQLLVLVLFSSIGLFINNYLSIFQDFFCYSLGILAWLHLRNPLPKKVFMAAFTSLLLISVYIHYHDLLHLIGVYFAFFAILFQFRIPVPSFLGRISYALFLTHIPIGTRVTHLASRYFSSDSMRVVSLLVSIGICIGFAYVYHVVIEIHLQKKIDLLFNRKKQVDEAVFRT